MEIIKIIIEKVLNFILTIIGKNLWKKKDEYEFVKVVLDLVYEVEEKIENICDSRIMSGEEFMSLIQSKEISEREKNNAKVREFFKRYENNKEEFYRLYELRNQFKIIFGKDKAKPFEDLKEILKEMDSDSLLFNTFIKRSENIEFNLISSNFSLRINKILEEIENTCKPEPWFSKIFKKFKQTGKEQDKK